MAIPRLLQTLGVEYMVHSPAPERGPEGTHIYYCSLHERGVVTDRGIEFAAPPVSGSAQRPLIDRRRPLKCPDWARQEAKSKTCP